VENHLIRSLISRVMSTLEQALEVLNRDLTIKIVREIEIGIGIGVEITKEKGIEIQCLLHQVPGLTSNERIESLKDLRLKV
jgi:hypothetical protein